MIISIIAMSARGRMLTRSWNLLGLAARLCRLCCFVRADAVCIGRLACAALRWLCRAVLVSRRNGVQSAPCASDTRDLKLHIRGACVAWPRGVACNVLRLARLSYGLGRIGWACNACMRCAGRIGWDAKWITAAC